MAEFSIKEKCHINTNVGEDTFVGIKYEENEFSVNFPLGFQLSEDEADLRKEILLLIKTIAETTGRKDSYILQEHRSYNATGFPIQAYIAIIVNFAENGYYRETETVYKVSDHGKINWSRTIKTQRPFLQDDKAYYLQFVTYKNPVKDNELITLIHEYCVRESFEKIGWLFTNVMPKKPRIKFNKQLFLSVVRTKLIHTFNDKNRELFQNMLAVIESLQDNDAPVNFRYGTYRFEYVWEALIDKVYGIRNKEHYFPKTEWILPDRNHSNASLEPDTIMIWNGNVFVLDAKYYKFGSTKVAGDLPESSSISKQITYGEYIAKDPTFKKIHGADLVVYNAFLMPFNPSDWEVQDGPYYIGEARSNWKSSGKEYERIQGILIDIKHVMKIGVSQDQAEISKLAKLIEDRMR